MLDTFQALVESGKVEEWPGFPGSIPFETLKEKALLGGMSPEQFEEAVWLARSKPRDHPLSFQVFFSDMDRAAMPVWYKSRSQ